MTDAPVPVLTRTQRRRFLLLGLLRALISASVLVALYFLLPLEGFSRVPLVVSLAIALVVIVAVFVIQIHAIVRADHPALRAVEALAITAPLFILVFASTYFLMESGDPASFSPSEMTRVDSLYMTVTTFATVGFGDITPTSQEARLLVTVQMILNLLVLGGGLRVFLGAVNRGRQSKAPNPDAAPAEPS